MNGQYVSIKDMGTKKQTKKGDRNAAVEITPSRHHAPFQKLFPPKRKPRR